MLPTKRIVLIDDDQTTNALNKLIIERSKLVDEIVLFAQAEEALKFLDTDEGRERSLILLDINMPIMDGWEFVSEYGKLNGGVRKDYIVMLTSSIDPSDMSKAENLTTISEYKTKPLSFEMLHLLVSKYLN